MVETTRNAATTTASQEYPITGKSIAALLVGWALPGAGHLMLGKFVRGGLLLVSIASMFFLGVMMQGKVYSPNTGDILDMLGFAGDVGSGLFYALAQTMSWGQQFVTMASADYGTKFIVVAGLLNVMAAVDAHHIALGKKS